MQVKGELSMQDTQACRLEVEPRQFAKAVNVLAHLDPKTEWAEIDFDGDTLMMRVGDTEQRIPAAGSWPGLLHFRSRFARALAGRPMTKTPLELLVEDGRLTVGSFTFPCSSQRDADTVQGPNQDRIAEAAHILKKLHVSQEKVAALVANANPEYAALWRDGYAPMIDRIANAWKILAPLGVEPHEIRQAIEESVRYAFNAAAANKRE
jgi:hypothetical protein